MRILRNTFAQIDLSALKHNLLSVKSCLEPGTSMYFCIKADAYGHGSAKLAQAAQSIGITDFAVELAEEGVYLRENGINGQILVLGRANDAQMKEAVFYGLSQCAADEHDIFELQNAAQQTGKTASAHLKIDTGMGRIGISGYNRLFDVIKALKCSPNVELTGAFTHFACADEEDKTFTHSQASVFNDYIKLLNAEGFHPKLHIANSAACIELPEYSMDYARCGIAAYGYAPGIGSGNRLPDLQPVMSLYAEISQIKEVPEGFRVGYNSTYMTDKPSRIATVQIGYADGYPRQLSNRGKMLVKGTDGYSFAPVIGRVCMDQCMIDVTNISGVKKGDLALVMGSAESLNMDASVIADLCGTISYEILTGFSSRVPRIYVNA